MSSGLHVRDKQPPPGYHHTLSIIISIRSWRPFSLSACLHNTSETAAQAECRVKLASTMLRRSRQSQFHWNLFLCEIHKTTILLYLLFLFYKSKEIRRLSFYLSSDYYLKRYRGLGVIVFSICHNYPALLQNNISITLPTINELDSVIQQHYS